jgi:trimethylamine--corrinoid protein Co-methyltransferase
MPGDVPDLLEPLYSYLVLAHESDKALGGPGISHPFQARYVAEMAEIVTGADGSDGVYPVDLAFSPVSPLLLGAEVTEAMLHQVRRGGVIVEILPCPAAGTTAPATISAALAQQNAEVLVGLVLVQLIKPGTPVYYGPRLSAVDPRTGVVISGGPETGVSSNAATLLARRYHMACDCYGPTTDSKTVDGQMALEHAFNAATAMMARPRLLSGIGDVAAGVASNPEAIVVDDEILNYAFYALSERPWDQDALDVDAMVEGVLSGRGFLGTKHTRRYIRAEFLVPGLGYRGGLTEWLDSGRHGLVDLAAEKASELAARDPVGISEDRLEALCDVIGRAAAEVGVSEYPDPRTTLTL